MQYVCCSVAIPLFKEIIMGLKASLFETSLIIFVHIDIRKYVNINYTILEDSTLDSIMIQDKDVAVLVG